MYESLRHGYRSNIPDEGSDGHASILGEDVDIEEDDEMATFGVKEGGGGKLESVT